MGLNVGLDNSSHLHRDSCAGAMCGYTSSDLTPEGPLEHGELCSRRTGLVEATVVHLEDLDWSETLKLSFSKNQTKPRLECICPVKSVQRKCIIAHLVWFYSHQGDFPVPKYVPLWPAMLPHDTISSFFLWVWNVVQSVNTFCDRTSLVVQWLRNHLQCRKVGSIPGWGTKISHATTKTHCSQIIN